jgi:hypothetical protein
MRTIIKDNRSPELIEAAGQLMDRDTLHAQARSREIQEAREQVIAAREDASRAHIDRYSDEKGREANKQFEEYLEGSIAENFRTKIALVNERNDLAKEVCDLRLALAQERAEAEIAIKRRQAEADLEYEMTMKKIHTVKASKAKLWVWRILWPALGVAVSVLTYILLNL